MTKRTNWRQRKLKYKWSDYRILYRLEFGKDCESGQSESDQEMEKKIIKNRNKIIFDEESKEEIKQKKLKKRK